MRSSDPEASPNPHLLALEDIEALLSRSAVLHWEIGARSRIMNLHDGDDVGGIQTEDLLACLPGRYRSLAVRSMIRLFLRGGFLDFEGPLTLASGKVLWVQLTAYRTLAGGPPRNCAGCCAT
ncbi:hypothetical protein [Deinococcus gobiensis]|uniref:Uncharacterized protein n=1 Tax=Deinococcus gobiensis (strain DSM 21396 / JCM 16679 / CGMCC 1.7299 / I-0) TaxID=745776 RepID=H8H053_DEIGI|nr:hypothetical protein [Deinococcus gobiensis]AFD27105.1 hypothetical protein DGo_PA0219 [Deinococcus gobiensis I-0]